MRVDSAIRTMVRRALREDLGSRGDVTTKHFLDSGRSYGARMVAKRAGVLCGTPVAAEVFRQACPRARVSWKMRDGARLRPGTLIAQIRGPRGILTAERTSLNFIQHLSGIATLTSAYVAAARGTRARIYDTRKTLPGWRLLAKYAVRVGGGRNHRMGLHDMAMLKDNHLAGLGASGEPSPEDLARVRAFRRRYPRLPIEIEAKDEAEVRLALALGADVVMLDNMGTAALRRHIRSIRKLSPRTEIEISGGVDLRTVGRLARLGPDRISIGRLTHSAPALDISMKLDK
ncbi:carboxylating nicotinate-nucleotide diphosphorylase [Elusimicrobiota bacterium]